MKIPVAIHLGSFKIYLRRYPPKKTDRKHEWINDVIHYHEKTRSRKTRWAKRYEVHPELRWLAAHWLDLAAFLLALISLIVAIKAL